MTSKSSRIFSRLLLSIIIIIYFEQKVNNEIKFYQMNKKRSSIITAKRFIREDI